MGVQSKIRGGSGRPSSGYRLADGTKVPGVTTIIKPAGDSGPLMGWSFKRGIELCLEAVAEHGWPDPDVPPQYEDVKSHCWANRYNTRDDAAAVGSCAHDMIEAYYRGGDAQEPLQALSEPLRAKAQRAFDSFREWTDLTRLEPVAMEIPLVSESMRFGGTFDLLARHPDGRLVILDWKSSKGLYAEVPIQLAAYRTLLREHGDDAQDAHALRISKAGTSFDHRWYSLEMLDAAEQVFRACLDLHHANAALKELVA